MDQDGADLADGGRVSVAGAAGVGRRGLPRPVRAVVFDLDGTMIDTEPAYRAAFQAALAELGWTMPASAYQRLVGLPSTTRRVLLPRMLGAGFPVAAFFDRYYRHRALVLDGVVAIKPGVNDMLAFLARARLPCALATSASRETALTHLAASGLLDRFGHVVTRDDVSHGKPAPDSFCRAASLLGVPARDCLAVEDSLAGVTAALAAGMMTVMIPDAVAPTEALMGRCDATLGSLHELIALLRHPAGELTRKNDRSPVRV